MKVIIVTSSNDINSPDKVHGTLDRLRSSVSFSSGNLKQMLHDIFGIVAKSIVKQLICYVLLGIFYLGCCVLSKVEVHIPKFMC